MGFIGLMKCVQIYLRRNELLKPILQQSNFVQYMKFVHEKSFIKIGMR